MVRDETKMNRQILPFLAWFAIGIAGTYATNQLRPVLGSEIATNLAFLIFLLGGIAAYNINKRLRP
jgi:hypothetical protein